MTILMAGTTCLPPLGFNIPIRATQKCPFSVRWWTQLPRCRENRPFRAILGTTPFTELQKASLKSNIPNGMPSRLLLTVVRTLLVLIKPCPENRLLWNPCTPLPRLPHLTKGTGLGRVCMWKAAPVTLMPCLLVTPVRMEMTVLALIAVGWVLYRLFPWISALPATAVAMPLSGIFGMVTWTGPVTLVHNIPTSTGVIAVSGLAMKHLSLNLWCTMSLLSFGTLTHFPIGQAFGALVIVANTLPVLQGNLPLPIQMAGCPAELIVDKMTPVPHRSLCTMTRSLGTIRVATRPI